MDLAASEIAHLLNIYPAPKKVNCRGIFGDEDLFENTFHLFNYMF